MRSVETLVEAPTHPYKFLHAVIDRLKGRHHGLVIIPYVDGGCIVVRGRIGEREYFVPGNIRSGDDSVFTPWIDELSERVREDFGR